MSYSESTISHQAANSHIGDYQGDACPVDLDAVQSRLEVLLGRLRENSRRVENIADTLFGCRPEVNEGNVPTPPPASTAQYLIELERAMNDIEHGLSRF